MLDSLNDAEQAIEENFGNTIKLSIGETFIEADEDLHHQKKQNVTII